MLVLARKQNEAIVINDQITIEVLQIKGKTIRLGIQAPRDVRIVRGELEPLIDDSRDSDAEPASTATEKAATNGKQEGGLSMVGDLPTGDAEPTPNGLQRFIKANQVGEGAPDYRTRTSDANRSVKVQGNRPTQVSYEGSRNRARTQRVSVIANTDSSSDSGATKYQTTKYQTTCEIELPIATFDSNHN